jgi:endonuclease YncB( thermonuclease family)
MLVLLLTTAFAADPPPGGWPLPPRESEVASVYDGDTMTLVTGDKVRLRWVNTPELKPAEAYGLEAREATERFVSGHRVTLLLGSDNPRDGYGRIVAGIQTEQGNLSLYLLEQGLGHLFVIPPDNTDLTAFIAAQDAARAARRGIWSTDHYQGGLHMTSFHANGPGDDTQFVNGEYLRVANISAEPLNLDGFSIQNAAGQRYPFPAVTIPVGHTFKLISGRGTHQANPSEQLEVYLGSDTPIWDNQSDRATIFDRFGQVVDTRTHEVKRATP